MNSATTPAEAALLASQKRKPPLYPMNRLGRDRVQALAEVLFLSDKLREHRAQKRIAWGEIGDWQPDARSYRVGADHYVIELTSGHMDFLYAVGRAMAGASVIYGQDGHPKNEQAMVAGDIAGLTMQLFKQWKRYCQPQLWDLFWKDQRIAHGDFVLSDHAIDRAETIVTCAELFTIAHEMGHVAIGLGLSQPAHGNDEIAADLVGIDFYLESAVIKELGERFGFVGPAFSVRMTECLTRCGVEFSAAYPPAAERLDHIFRRLRKHCESEQYFDEASTVMVAQMSFLDDIERLIGAREGEDKPNRWYGLVGAIAALQSLITERLPCAAFLEMFERGIKGQPARIASEMAQTLKRYYGPDLTQTSFFPEELRRLMGLALDACIKLMPNERQVLFS